MRRDCCARTVPSVLSRTSRLVLVLQRAFSVGSGFVLVPLSINGECSFAYSFDAIRKTMGSSKCVTSLAS